MRTLPAALVLATALLACASSPPAAPAQPSTSSAAPGQIDGTKAHELVQGGAVLVDVRSPDEYAQKHIDGAINVPVEEVATHDFGGKDKPVVLYCMHGVRSAKAAETLRAAGYTQVYLLGPMSAWDK